MIAIDILPNISRTKGHQTMKFGQVIEYNMKNIFLEKSYAKCGGETIQLVFTICQVENYRSILKLNCRPCAFT